MVLCLRPNLANGKNIKKSERNGLQNEITSYPVKNQLSMWSTWIHEMHKSFLLVFLF
ncbi:hypothetical protein HK096_008519, partial [Nowakowskiella sp. JEL0078]